MRHLPVTWARTAERFWDFVLRRRSLPAAPKATKPRCEQLEDRVVPATAGRPLPYPVIAAGPGSGPGLVKLFDAETGIDILNLVPYDAAFRGGVRVAVGDLTRDGFPDVVTAPGAGGGPHVRAYDGKSGRQIPTPVGSFFAYDPGFLGGVQVAAGDVTGDGHADVVTAADRGGGPHVRVFDALTGAEVANFFAFEPEFRGGVRVAARDLTGDGKAELILAAGDGGAPRVRVLDAVTLAPIPGPLGDFFAFDPAGAGCRWRPGT